jgi:hypothetical protein
MTAWFAKIALMSVCVSCNVLSAAQFDFVVSPPVVKLTLQPGSAESVTITLFNRDERTLILEIEKSALAMDIDGRAKEGANGDNDFSCAGWLTTSMDFVEIPPGESVQVPVRIKVPFGVHGGRYGIVLFRSVDEGVSKSDLHISGRLGSIFMIELFGMKERTAGIDHFRIQQGDSGIQFLAMVRNEGNIHLTAAGSVIIRNSESKIIDRVQLDTGTGTILPEHRRQFKATWHNMKKMKPGSYTATLRMRVKGMGKLLQQEQKFEISE